MIGEKIKKRRKEMGLTQEELVKKAQELQKEQKDKYNIEDKTFDQSQLSKWENNEQVPNTKNLWLLSNLLEVSFFELDTPTNNERIQLFYNSGYDLATKIEQDLRLKINILMKHNEQEKTKELFSEILELYMYNNIQIPDNIGIMIPIFSANKENYSEYINAFITGLFNGNLKKIKTYRRNKNVEKNKK